MARYFSDFDHKNFKYVDAIGTEISDVALIPSEAAGFLAQVMRDETANDDDRVMVVNVRNEAGRIVCRARLTFESEWLDVDTAVEVSGRLRPV